MDSFNIFVSGLSPQMVSTTWLPADPISLEQAFHAAESMLANYSNLLPLLATGID
ncbi:MAG: hypothetical protein IPM98_19235 [Lewinellaceae bacterium]|nr:hypothetical protein [Lewinellaceae bacterium]